MAQVEMHHPDAGAMTCSEPAARVHERSGWVRVAGVERITVASADGSPLTTGTVFPPETFDDDDGPGSVDVTTDQPGAGGPTKTTATTATPNKKEA